MASTKSAGDISLPSSSTNWAWGSSAWAWARSRVTARSERSCSAPCTKLKAPNTEGRSDFAFTSSSCHQPPTATNLTAWLRRHTGPVDRPLIETMRPTSYPCLARRLISSVQHRLLRQPGYTASLDVVSLKEGMSRHTTSPLRRVCRSPDKSDPLSARRRYRARHSPGASPRSIPVHRSAQWPYDVARPVSGP